MTPLANVTPTDRPSPPAPGPGPVPAAGGRRADEELCGDVLAALRRSDQRRRGERYVRGLLSTPGRKTMRNIAARLGEHAGEQSFHHFISCSTWDWSLLRARLARHLETELAPRAWVVRPIVVPKAGNQSVGVERRYVPHLRQTVNSQQSWGLWYVSDTGAAPVNWRLSIGGGWLEDAALRRRAGIPEDVPPQSVEGLTAGVVAETASWGLPRKPVVMDAREAPVAGLIHMLSASAQPFLLRVSGSTTLLAPTISGAGRTVAASAARIAELARSQQRPVEWVDPVEPAVLHTSLLALLPVRWPELPVARTGPAGGRQSGRPAPPLTLAAEWRPDRQQPTELWVTNMADVGRGTLLRLGKLTRRVAVDFADTGRNVGLQDFEGRSYPGWHRHVTLASLAHAMRVLGAQDVASTGPAAASPG